MSIIDQLVDTTIAHEQAARDAAKVKRRMEELSCNIAGTQRAGVYPSADMTHAVVVMPDKAVHVMPINEVDQ